MSGSKELAAASAESALGFKTVDIAKLTEDEKNVLKATVAVNATDPELSHFLNVALAQKLNPFKREVWFIKMGGRPVIMTSADGYLTIAKRDPQFDSIQAAEVREGDVFKLDPVTGEMEHRIEPKNRGAILGAWAMIVRKDAKRFAKYVAMNEYQGQTDPWKKYPSAMIQKAAKAALCKEWANITGVMAEEMMPVDAIDVDTSPAAADASASIKDDLLANIAACKTNDELDALKQTMPPLVGKLFAAEKTEVMAAAVAKRKELLALDVTPVEEKPAEVVDAEIVDPEAEETPAEEERADTVISVDEVKMALRDFKDVDALHAYWNDVVPTLNLSEADLTAAEKVYEMRIPLLKGEAPKKKKAA